MVDFRVILLVVLAISLQLHGATGKFEDLGVQLTSMTLQGTAFTTDPTGRDLACSVVRGAPAKLIVLDAHTGEMLHRLSLEGAHGAWNATAASDGSIYVGTDDNGHLYRWIPGEKAVHDLGQVGKDQTFAWDECPGDDGEVFVSTYPGCQVIRYHPKDGFHDVGKGAVAAGENYARGLDRDPGTGKIFVGVGTKAHLIELDPKTGQKRDILPSKFRDKKFAYSTRVSAGKLFVMLADGNDGLVIDCKTGELEAEIPKLGGPLVVSPKSPYDDKVYVNADGKLFAYDLKTKTAEPAADKALPAIIGLRWIKVDDAQVLAVMTKGGLIHFDPRTRERKQIALKIPPEPTPIQSIARGPDGKIYSGGYLVGGLAAFDPKTGKHEQLGRISQSESIGVMRGKIYLGLYPGARLVEYDPAQPWDGTNNPHQFESLDRFDQDRPFGTLGVDALNKVFFGTVADYGTLGGAISVYDVAAKKVEVFRNVVQDQCVVSLAYSNDLVVGSTTVAGGLGIAPTTKEAKLFLFDPKTNKKIFETVPVKGATLITGLLVGPDKNIWGVADDDLFIFDVPNRKVVSTMKLYPIDEASRHAKWRDAFLAVHPDGRVYGTMGNKMFRIDPSSKQVTILRDKDVALLALDDAGRVYFRSATNLWRFTP